MRQIINFRIITDQDKLFLEGLYANSRAWEFQHVIMSDMEKKRFLKWQFEAQTKSYEMSFLSATHRIIHLENIDIGRLIVNRRDDALHIIDLSILSAYQGRGIGGDILMALKNEAEGGKVPVELSVIQTNPALDLYLRHGFIKTGINGQHTEMKWTANSEPTGL